MSSREDSHDERGSPLIIAAYKQGEPTRKKRVKVPPKVKWAEFLDLFYDRFGVSRDLGIEIYDEKGIEIVSVDDLLPDDVLVVREVSKVPRSTSQASAAPRTEEPPRVVAEGVPPLPLPSSARLTVEHFIQASSLGYYFLGKGNGLLRTHGKLRQVHCIIKVPHPNFQQPLRSEAALLSAIAGHKGVIVAPSVYAFDARSEDVKQVCGRLAEDKCRLLQDLLTSPDHTSTAYVYPLYGITMATKIKSDLVPGAVLRYSYQLADIMHFLEEKGVIHLNLLPENLQVMSNDRIVLCNFETAIRLDQSKQMVKSVANIMTPKNKKSLSPEAISALTTSRSESGMVDFTGQYAWNFGVLAVLFSTGQHPLRNYPEQYDSQGMIRYKSIHYQAHPDPNKYPSLFTKIVRRALSCDPARRPTIVQILSLIRRDSKILTIMAEHREKQGVGLQSAPAVESQAASLSPLQSQQPTSASELPITNSSEAPPRNPSEAPCRDPSPEHSYENLATKWYVEEDTDLVPQSSVSSLQGNQLTAAQEVGGVSPSGLLSTPYTNAPVPRAPPSFLLQSMFTQPNASQGGYTQDSYHKFHGSQSLLNSGSDSISWFPTALHSEWNISRMSFKSTGTGSLIWLNSSTQSDSKSAQDNATRSTPDNFNQPLEVSQETMVQEWSDSCKVPASNISKSSHVDASKSSCIDSFTQASSCGSASALHNCRSSSLSAKSKTCTPNSPMAGTRGPKQCGVTNKCTPPVSAKDKLHGSRNNGLLQWERQGGSRSLWPCPGMTDPAGTMAHSSPDIPHATQSSREHSQASKPLRGCSRQELCHTRRRSFSGFVPASSYALSAPVPPPQTAPLSLAPAAAQQSTGSVEVVSAKNTTILDTNSIPCLDTNVTTGQSCMSPILEASQEVPLPSQPTDHLSFTWTDKEDRTSPFRHGGLDLPPRGSRAETSLPSRDAPKGGKSVGGMSKGEASSGGRPPSPIGGTKVGGAKVCRPSVVPSGGAAATQGAPVRGMGSTQSTTEQAAHLGGASRRQVSQSTRQQIPAPPTSAAKGGAKRQSMTWDLEVLHQAFSDMDLASGHTLVARSMQGDLSTSDQPTSRAGHAGHPPLQAQAHDVHLRQVQTEGVSQGPLQDTLAPPTSTTSVVSHTQIQTSFTPLGMTGSTSQLRSHSPLSRSHSASSHSHVPPSHSTVQWALTDHSSPSVTTTASSVVTVSAPSSAAPLSSAGPTPQGTLDHVQRDAPSFLEPPPSYDEIFGTREGQSRSHTLPSGQTLGSQSGRSRFTNLFSFFRRGRGRAATPSVVVPSSHIASQPTGGSDPPLPSGTAAPALAPSQHPPHTTRSTATPPSAQSTPHSSEAGRNGRGAAGGRSGRGDGESGNAGDSGRGNASDGGRGSMVEALHVDEARGGAPAHVPAADLHHQSQASTADHRVNPPYRHPPPFVPAIARDSSRAAAARGGQVRSQARGSAHQGLLQGAHSTQLGTGHRSLCPPSGMSPAASHNAVQLRAATNRRNALRPRPQSELLSNYHPQLLQFTLLEEGEFNCSQVPPIGCLSASYTNIDALPNNLTTPSLVQGGGASRPRERTNAPRPDPSPLPSSTASTRTPSAVVSRSMASAQVTSAPASAASNMVTSCNAPPFSSGTTRLFPSPNLSNSAPYAFLCSPLAANSTQTISNSSSSPPYSNSDLSTIHHLQVPVVMSSASSSLVTTVPNISAPSNASHNTMASSHVYTLSGTHSNTITTNPTSNSVVSSHTCTSMTAESTVNLENRSSVSLSQFMSSAMPTPPPSGPASCEPPQAPLSSLQQRAPDARSGGSTVSSELVHNCNVPANITSSTGQHSTEVAILIGPDWSRERKSCGHLCLKERRFCCLCQHTGHRGNSQEEYCILCTRHSTGGSAILHSSSVGNCHSGEECTCGQNEPCSVHRLALSQPMASAEGSRRPPSQNCIAM